jgi:hypothetical protein
MNDVMDKDETFLAMFDESIEQIENCSEELWNALASNENSDSTKFTVVGYRIKMIDDEVEKLKDLRDKILIEIKT